MKKLTAGILTVLLGIVSANSADAAVASKGYVDAKAAAEATAAKNAAADALSTAKSELEGKINAKVAQTDYDDKVAALEAADETFATKASMTTELSKKQDNLTVTGGVLTWDAATSTLGLTGIATNTSVENLQNTVNKLDGNEGTEGSVKKQIADAIASEIQRSNTAYATAAQGALADSALQDADIASSITQNEDQAGKLATSGLVAAAIAASQSDISSELSDVADTAKAADALSKSNKSAIDAINNADTGILKQAQQYADGLADNYDAAGSASDAEAAAKAYADSLAVNYDAAGSASDAEAAAKAYADSLAVNYDAAGAASTAQAAAIEAAKAETEEQIGKLALKAISQVPAECSAMDKYCALTYGTDGYVWEVIERATDEVVGAEGRTVTPIKPTQGN